MPQASDAQRARWPGWDRQAIDHLIDRGYRYTKNWTWIKPDWIDEPSVLDLDAIQFLIDEFDWGGLQRRPMRTQP